MGRTSAQTTADAQLSAAVEAAARAYGLPVDQGYSIVEFIVVVEMVKFGDSRPGDATYEEFHGVVYQDGATRSAVAIGLCRIAEQLIGEGAVATSAGSADVEPFGD